VNGVERDPDFAMEWGGGKERKRVCVCGIATAKCNAGLEVAKRKGQRRENGKRLVKNQKQDTERERQKPDSWASRWSKMSQIQDQAGDGCKQIPP
jgi:hypothetical protein